MNVTGTNPSSVAAMRRLTSLCLGSSKAAGKQHAHAQGSCLCCAGGVSFQTTTAFPSPFHSHSFAAGRSGGNANSAPAGVAGEHVNAEGARGMATATNTPFPTSSPASAFLGRKGPRDAGHVHSAACGAHDAPLDQSSFAASVKNGVKAMKGEAGHAAPLANTVSDQKWSLAQLLHHNQRFVAGKSYEPFLTDRYPFKKIVVVTCMDTRLTELLPRALDLKNGDAKIVKVAGAMVAHPFGSVMRSILVAVYALGAEHIIVVGHHDCGMTGMDPAKILTQAKQRGIPDTTFKTLNAAGLNLESWLSGFASVQSSVLHSVDTIRNHPLLNFSDNAAQGGGEGMPRLPKITVTGMVICPTTGKLDLLTPAEPDVQAVLDTDPNKQKANL